jgi:hypothetical protein
MGSLSHSVADVIDTELIKHRETVRSIIREEAKDGSFRITQLSKEHQASALCGSLPAKLRQRPLRRCTRERPPGWSC